MSANDKQVAGEHYQSAIQPCDFIVANNIGYLEVNVIKSVRIIYEIFDSPKYRKLSSKSKALDLFARRVAKNKLDAEFSLTATDLDSIGLGNAKTLAKALNGLVDSGYLIKVREPQYGVEGKTRVCGLYRLGATQFYSKKYHYVSRWRKKGGVEDLYKAQHYLEKLIQMEMGDE